MFLVIDSFRGYMVCSVRNYWKILYLWMVLFYGWMCTLRFIVDIQTIKHPIYFIGFTYKWLKLWLKLYSNIYSVSIIESEKVMNENKFIRFEYTGCNKSGSNRVQHRFHLSLSLFIFNTTFFCIFLIRGNPLVLSCP